MIGNVRIMPHVRGGHHKIVRTDYRCVFRESRSVHGYIFPEYIVVSDTQPGWFTLVLQVLRRAANDGAGIEMIVRSDPGQGAGDINVRAQHTVRSDLDTFINNAVRPDVDRRIQLRLRVDYCRWMNHNFKVM